MNEVLVQGSYRNLDYELLIIVGMLASGGGALALLLGETVVGWELLAAGLCGFLAAIAIYRLRVRRRLWARDTGKSLILRGSSGEREIPDEDFRSCSHYIQHEYSNGVHAGWTRYCIIDAPDRHDRIVILNLTSTFYPDQPDPLGHWIERLLARLVAQAEADLRAGKEASGAAWRIRGRELTVQGTPTPFLLEDLNSVAVFDGHIKLWRRNQEEPCAKVPLVSTNATVLERLLLRHLQERQPEPQIQVGGGLGRVLFERVRSLYFLKALSLGILLSLIGVVLLVLTVFLHEMRTDWPMGPLFLAAGVLITFYACAYLHGVTRCHEHGVSQRTIFGTLSISFADVDAFTFSVVNLYENGRTYVGTELRVVFESTTGRSLSFTSMNLGNDSDFDSLRDQVAQIVSGRLYRRLRSGEIVPWTKQLSFGPDCLILKPSANIEGTIPFTQIARHEIDRGWFRLWVNASREPIAEAEVASRNFFPGYWLFHSLLQLAQANVEATPANFERANPQFRAGPPTP